ncbi:MAG TPA: cytochrome c [Candidatus Baltobacteraceae bacterium]
MLSPRLQVAAGAKVFAMHCASCHGAQLEGGAGPTLVGPDFSASVQQDGLALGDVFGIIAYQMPYDAPSSLSHADYERVMAFLLDRNHQSLPAGGIVYDDAIKSKAPFFAPIAATTKAPADAPASAR